MIAESGKGVVVCGVDFDWGNAGKLPAIMRSCRSTRPAQRFVILGTKLGRTVLSGESAAAWHADSPQDSRDLR